MEESHLAKRIKVEPGTADGPLELKQDVHAVVKQEPPGTNWDKDAHGMHDPSSWGATSYQLPIPGVSGQPMDTSTWMTGQHDSERVSFAGHWPVATGPTSPGPSPSRTASQHGITGSGGPASSSDDDEHDTAVQQQQQQHHALQQLPGMDHPSGTADVASTSRRAATMRSVIGKWVSVRAGLLRQHYPEEVAAEKFGPFHLKLQRQIDGAAPEEVVHTVEVRKYASGDFRLARCGALKEGLPAWAVCTDWIATDRNKPWLMVISTDPPDPNAPPKGPKPRSRAAQKHSHTGAAGQQGSRTTQQQDVPMMGIQDLHSLLPAMVPAAEPLPLATAAAAPSQHGSQPAARTKQPGAAIIDIAISRPFLIKRCPQQMSAQPFIPFVIQLQREIDGVLEQRVHSAEVCQHGNRWNYRLRKTSARAGIVGLTCLGWRSQGPDMPVVMVISSQPRVKEHKGKQSGGTAAAGASSCVQLAPTRPGSSGVPAAVVVVGEMGGAAGGNDSLTAGGHRGDGDGVGDGDGSSGAAAAAAATPGNASAQPGGQSASSQAPRDRSHAVEVLQGQVHTLVARLQVMAALMPGPLTSAARGVAALPALRGHQWLQPRVWTEARGSGHDGGGSSSSSRDVDGGAGKVVASLTGGQGVACLSGVHQLCLSQLSRQTQAAGRPQDGGQVAAGAHSTHTQAGPAGSCTSSDTLAKRGGVLATSGSGRLPDTLLGVLCAMAEEGDGDVLAGDCSQALALLDLLASMQIGAAAAAAPPVSAATV